MKVFKAIVILVAISLVAGFVALFNQMQNKKANARAEAATLLPAPKGPAFDLAIQGKVSQLIPHGKGFALLVDEPSKNQELILLDTKGNPLRRIRLIQASDAEH
ncbi:MAG: hypothetical protein HQL53_01500 [Magnetococcales bacterium]|nr:hypothetical protein [Magnetococcales bacterium]